MRALTMLLLAACGTSSTLDEHAAPDASTDASGEALDASVAEPWGERCGNGLDDDGDGLVDEDCSPRLFAGLFAPGVSDAPVLGELEQTSGRPLAVLQTYHSLSALGIARTAPDLLAIFARGQVAHLNIEPTGYAPQQYATPTQPPLADDLAAMARAIGDALAAATQGRVLVTFGAEMNGSWTTWGCLPAAQFVALYRAAHAAITSELDARAIDRRRVRWVYGPNNVSSASCGSAAGYYPGHAYVDLLGMSSYRAQSDTVGATVIAPMAALFDALAYPTAWRRDRFVLLQTGSRALADRTAWIGELFATLAADERVAGVIYFSAADWTAPASVLAPSLAQLPVADRGLDGVFLPHFWDVPYDHPAFHEIQALRDAGITSGCATAPARFCPDDPVRASDAATLLGRTFQGASSPTAALGDPVLETELAAAVMALGGVPPQVTAIPATRARAAVILAHAAELRPTAP